MNSYGNNIENLLKIPNLTMMWDSNHVNGLNQPISYGSPLNIWTNLSALGPLNNGIYNPPGLTVSMTPPTILSSGASIAKPAVYFNGTTDFMTVISQNLWSSTEATTIAVFEAETNGLIHNNFGGNYSGLWTVAGDNILQFTIYAPTTVPNRINWFRRPSALTIMVLTQKVGSTNKLYYTSRLAPYPILELGPSAIYKSPESTRGLQVGGRIIGNGSSVDRRSKGYVYHLSTFARALNFTELTEVISYINYTFLQ